METTLAIISLLGLLIVILGARKVLRWWRNRKGDLIFDEPSTDQRAWSRNFIDSLRK